MSNNADGHYTDFPGQPRPQMPGQQRPWMEAMEAQLDALSLVNLFLREAPKPIRDLKSWNVDRRLLEAAAPYAWSEEVTTAVLTASRSIPLDTPLNKWNLSTSCVWWHFAKPLPWQTVSDPSLGIRALCFGWVPTEAQDFGLPVCCWIDEPHPGQPRGAFVVKDGEGKNQIEWNSVGKRCRVTPSQTFEWERDITLDEMLGRTREYHRMRYGKGGESEHAPQVGEDVFMAATEGVARFILAGLAWLGQKVLVEASGYVERHRRKDFERRTKRSLDGVRVVSLRASRYVQKAVGETTIASPFDPKPEPTVWSCRWVVSGHFRNQACGPKHGDRRLTWIDAFVKGPDDKEFRAPRQKAYVVDR